jgi:arginine decarboxylase
MEKNSINDLQNSLKQAFSKIKKEMQSKERDISRLSEELVAVKEQLNSLVNNSNGNENNHAENSNGNNQAYSERFLAGYEKIIEPGLTPKKVFFTNGVGKHREQLRSFELALRDAGIEKANIVNISSILPPNCKITSKERGLKQLKPGQITFVVLARNSSNEPNRLIAASIGVAIPADKTMHGYLSEHHSFGETENKAGEYAEDLAASMLASTYGVEFDADMNYDQRKEIYKLDRNIVRTANITKSAICDKNGLWTTVVSAAVFLF